MNQRGNDLNVYKYDYREERVVADKAWWYQKQFKA